MQDFKCWVSPDYGPQFFRFFFTVHRCKTMVLDISHATLDYSILENFRGLGLLRTRTRTCSSRTRTRTRTWAPRTRTSNWKLVLEDKDFPRGQQHWLSTVLLTSDQLTSSTNSETYLWPFMSAII